MAVTVVVFPRFVSDEGRGARARRLLGIGLAGVLSLGFVTTAVLVVARHIFVDVLFGSRYGGTTALVGLLSVEGTVLGAVALLTYSTSPAARFSPLLPALPLLLWSP